MYEIHATSPVTLRLGASPAPGRILVLDATSTWKPADAQEEGDTVVIHLRAKDMVSGRTRLLVDPPAGLDCNDRDAPIVRSITIDGTQHPPAPVVDLAMEEIYGDPNVTQYENDITLCNEDVEVRALTAYLSFEPAGYIDINQVTIQALGRASNHIFQYSPQPDGTIGIVLISIGEDRITTGCDAILRVDYEILPDVPYGTDIYMNLLDVDVSDAVINPIPTDITPGVHHHWVPGDVQQDGDHDLFDILTSIDIFLSVIEDPSFHESDASDTNGDGDIDLFDLLALIDLFLNPPPPAGAPAAPQSMMSESIAKTQPVPPLVDAFIHGDPSAPVDLFELLHVLEGDESPY